MYVLDTMADWENGYFLQGLTLQKMAGALLLIGGDTWKEKSNQPILEVANSFLEKNILVVAICGATLGLANNGILNSYYHTSNALFFIRK